MLKKVNIEEKDLTDACNLSMLLGLAIAANELDQARNIVVQLLEKLHDVDENNDYISLLKSTLNQ